MGEPSENSLLPQALVKNLGCEAYDTCWKKMQDFTQTRTPETPDEIWCVEHPPVYTQGQAGKPEHVLRNTDIPIVKTDRGGQVTYHGPGQLVVYPLLDLKRLKLGVRALVSHIENSVIDTLALYGIQSEARADAPGVYVADQKIASLGLRVRRGCSFHGVAININADLQPFIDINPCGYAGLSMTSLQLLLGKADCPDVSTFSEQYVRVLLKILQLSSVPE
ncbi:Octanoyltransferase [Thalassocella blandensis]|nr:Octanoyltransferase [Thalassocella blandensis]